MRRKAWPGVVLAFGILWTAAAAAGPANGEVSATAGTETGGKDVVDDLSAVHGTEAMKGPPAARALLQRNGFVVLRKFYHRIFSPYLDQTEVPPFVTADSVHRTFHVIFEDEIAGLERAMAGEVAEITRRMAEALGERAGVLVDMGHHPFGVNVAQIVARLVGTGRQGGFHFNTRYAADDDHSVEPNLPMYAIFCELVAGGVVCAENPSRNWAYMIDQCSSLENRIRAVLHSIDSLQVSLAKALVLDQGRLCELQADRQIIGANRVLLDAFLTDVRPILRMARLEKGLRPDPVEAYDDSGYQQRIKRERG